MKEVLRKLAFPETTSLSPPPQKEPTKGAKKKVDIRVDFKNPDRQPSVSPTTSSFGKRKGARLGKTSRSPLPPSTRFPMPISAPKPIMVPTSILVLSPIDYMSKFMVPFIEKVMDVIGDGHCGFRAIAEFLGMTEESHIMIRRHFIQKLKDHRNDYLGVYAGEDRYNYILNSLHPPTNSGGIALVDKWLTFSDMRHILLIITIHVWSC
ncbi:hypothetical protein MTR_6g059570 [Medicago truncatula]|uniref:OTU domain-containing protein n=1 Tax=Medicago truncatula TaxID=3880 RepID=G7KMI0_MEDTR|nr:hypothetical protein MTR_6g059570 [Medicago truncatula]